jgi:methionine-rich copper-binding protein CopC
MNTFLLPMGLALTLITASAEAHAHLKASNPAEGAVVTEMPSAVVLTFSEAARMTAVSIQKDEQPKQTLKPPAATSSAAQITVAMPTLAPGNYTLSWRVVSDDNHIMSGELHFKVAMPMNKPMTR